jgi:hypothetical protein
MPNRQDRADALLRAADACNGVLTMELALVVIPHVHRSVITRILDRLVMDGVFVAVWQSFGQEKVWLTTVAPKGHKPGIRFVHESDSKGNTGTSPTTRRKGHDRYDGWDRPRAYLPTVVYHNLMAATLTYGFGAYATTLDAEIQRGAADVKIPDGIAWVTPREVLRVEVERLLGRSPDDWEKENGIAEAVCSFAARHHDDNTEPQHLIACDGKHRKALVKAINSIAATRGFDAAVGEKWWWVAIEDICANPVEFTIGQTSPTGSRAGIRAMRVNDPVRKNHQLQDKAMKTAKVEKWRAEQSALARQMIQPHSTPPKPTPQHDDGATAPHKP